MRPLVVRGIIRDLSNSQLEANVLFPTTSAADDLIKRGKQSWTYLSGYSYVLLAPGSDAKVITKKINEAIDRSFDARKLVNLKVRGSDFEHVRLNLVLGCPFTSEKFNFDMKQAGDRETVYGLGAIAIFLFF